MLFKPWTHSSQIICCMTIPGCKADNSGASASGSPFPSSPDWAQRRLQETTSVTALGWSGSGRSRASSSPLPALDVSRGGVSQTSPVLRGTAWAPFTGRWGDDLAPTGCSAGPPPGGWLRASIVGTVHVAEVSASGSHS